MFDFLSLSIPLKYENELLFNRNLVFEHVTTRDGEIKVNKDGFIINRAHYKDFTILVWQHLNKPNRIQIKGSIHKSFEGGTNYKDLTFNEFQSGISKLCEILKIEPSQIRIHSFEFGVNINPPIETNSLLDGIKTLSGKKYDRNTFNGNGLLYKFEFSHFRVKIYNKGLQYKRIEPILRIELKVKKMAFVQAKGVNITTIQNLLSGDWNTVFLIFLLNQWDKLILCPEGMINPEDIANVRSRRNFLNGLNSEYWTKLKQRTYDKQFKRFKALCKELSPIDLDSIIRTSIVEKWQQLANDQRGENDLLLYGNNPPFDNIQTEQRKCQSCGRDISNQKKDSKFCSETLYGPEVKKCRNIDSNPRNNRKRKEQRLYPGPTLFPIYIHYGLI